MKKRGILSRLFGGGPACRTGRRGDEFEASQSWQASVVQPTMMPTAVARPTVQHDPIMTRHVRLPLVQAVISGFFVAGLPTLIVVIVLALVKAKSWWWLLAPATFAVSTWALSGRFWFKLFKMDRETLMFIEHFTGMDLNKDGEVGEPKTTIVDFTDREKRHRYVVELPVNDDVMTEIARAMLESGGRYSFSRRDMMARSSISDDAFDKLQKEFIRRGWAAYRSEGKPNSGVDLLAAGRAVLRSYL